MKNPNFLILDEPTNDLDIDTLNVLEEFLTNYGGVLMMVSHDRYLLDKLTDQLFIMEEKGHVRIFNGNYSSYRLELEEAKQQAKKPAPVVQQAAPTAKKSKLSFKEAKELEGIEGEINTIEANIKDKNDQLNATGIDPKKIDEILKQIEVLNKQLDDKSARWMELTELNEG
jgi:ATP-binding cassette subfamily F protein uup